jgi:hypothetical protein
VIHLATDYEGAVLQQRSIVDADAWRSACAAPCDREIAAEGLEFRVVAPDMTPSNSFRIAPGYGQARLKVSGGAEGTRTLGLSLLIGGLPVTFGGMTLFGLGTVEDRDGLRTVGIATLAVGATAVLVSLPVLLAGSTTVRNDKGETIARRQSVAF